MVNYSFSLQFISWLSCYLCS